MVEKRKFPRFQAAETAFAIMEGEPMALDDISQTGIGLRFYGEEKLPQEFRVDLMFLLTDKTLDGIRCRKVTERHLAPRKSGGQPFRQIGLEFIDPAGDMLMGLEGFIEQDPLA